MVQPGPQSQVARNLDRIPRAGDEDNWGPYYVKLVKESKAADLSGCGG